LVQEKSINISGIKEKERKGKRIRKGQKWEREKDAGWGRGGEIASIKADFDRHERILVIAHCCLFSYLIHHL